MEELDTDETGFSVEQSDDSHGDPVVRLNGELDISSAAAFREAMEELVGKQPGRLVFDLSQLTFMDSSGIAVMVYVANNVKKVELLHASSIVRRVVEATGLSDILRLEPS
ncbi:MAG TPA: STAS domain-containing protein [Acidimicrobiales bacterium]|jgi:anti-sigma B factor antagonist